MVEGNNALFSPHSTFCHKVGAKCPGIGSVLLSQRNVKWGPPLLGGPFRAEKLLHGDGLDLRSIPPGLTWGLHPGGGEWQGVLGCIFEFAAPAPLLFPGCCR